MKKVFVLLAMVLGVSNMCAQDYDLQGLAEALNNYEFINFDVEFHDGLLKVYKNGKYGYINKKGELVIPCVYDEAGNFSEGWAYAVKYASSDEEEGLPILTASFIDKTGKLVLESQYTIKSEARFKDGLIVVLNDNGQYGYMNRQGRLAIPCKYDDADDFSEGFARVLKDGSYSFINNVGSVKSKQFKDNVSTFVCDGFIRYGGNYRDSYGGLSYGDGFYSINGNASIPLKYNGAGDFSEGLAFVSDYKDSWKGFINKNGNRVLDFKYLVEDDKPKFKEGLVVVLNDNGKYGYMNRNGRIVIPFQFDEARNFSDGLAAVRNNNKLGFVDKYGNSTFNPPAKINTSQKTHDGGTTTVTETMPSFVGGQTAMSRWISEHLQYPEEAMKKGIKGRVVASFYVERDGTISNVEIEKSVHPLLDNETIRLLKSMPKWIPGTQDGSPVRVKYAMPLTYNFTEE